MIYLLYRGFYVFIARKEGKKHTYIHIENERGASVRARWRNGVNALFSE